LPRQALPPTLVEQLHAPKIVQIGAPMRNIVHCIACHGGSDRKTAAPLLDGEPESYLKAQLQAFASGTCANDINEQMRTIARQMTPDEINTVAHYYSQR
jgi:cytochrome c553